MNKSRFNEFVAGFSEELAGEYATVRPTYPAKLFDWLADVAPGNERAWDAGTGAGELAAGLAERFQFVDASDTNAELLRVARRLPNLRYHSWRSEAPALADSSVDLIASGMAAHWFDTTEFYSQCGRILRPGGVLAVLGFYFFDTDDEIGELVHNWYLKHMREYEFPELVVLRERYEAFEFPFARLDVPPITMRETWTIEQLVAFLSQWIVNKRARTAGVDKLTPLLENIYERWNDDSKREIRWPLFIRATRFA